MDIKEEQICEEIRQLERECLHGDHLYLPLHKNLTIFIRKVAITNIVNGNKIVDLVFEKDQLRERVREILENEYIRDGKRYRKIGRNEKIKEGALHSWRNGKLFPIIDTYTVGDVPYSFACERDFYNPLSDKEISNDSKM